MDQDKFDGIAKAMASAGDRRHVLKRIAGGVLGGLLAVGAGPAGAAKKKCGTDGAKCNGQGHCCKGYYCNKPKGGSYGKCTKSKPKPVCKKDYETCSDGSECCSKHCDYSKGYGKCTPPPKCTPKTCSDYKGQCGTFDDTCGGTISCGCPKGYYCDSYKQTCKEDSPPPKPVCGQWCDPYDDKISCPKGCWCTSKQKDGSYRCAP